MIANNFKTAWRNLRKNKISSIINIGGLAIGIAASMLIGLWIWNELSFNKSHPNYKDIAIVMETRTTSNGIGISWRTPYPTGNELQKLYGNDFKHIVMASQSFNPILSDGKKRLTKVGYFMEPGITYML